ncbi:hypothetical protein Agub_g1766, partial [Astrephomene gubernaculifera]
MSGTGKMLKRKRTLSTDSARAGKAILADGLAGKQAAVILVDRSVRANETRRTLAQQCAGKDGTFIVLPDRCPEQCSQPRVTHLVLGSALLASDEARRSARQRLAPCLARWPAAVLLDEAWLTQLTSARRLPPTAGFEACLEPCQQVPGFTTTAAAAPTAAALLPLPRVGRYERWLGWWEARLDDMDEVGVLLQATFSDARCARVGNSSLVGGLRELKLYEMALREREDAVGTRALAYARAAASVQACSFRITGAMSEAFLAHHLPFVSRSCAAVVRQLALSLEGGGGGGGGNGHSGQGQGGYGASGGAEGRASGTDGGPLGPGGLDGGDDSSNVIGGNEGGDTAAGIVATCERLELFRRDLLVRDGEGALRPGSA